MVCYKGAVMFEFLFFILFIGVLFFTGLSFMAVLVTIGLSIVAMFLFGMIGVVIKLLPWIIVIALGLWFYKNYVVTTR